MKNSISSCSVLNACSTLACLFLLFGCGSSSTDSVKNAKDVNSAKIDSQKVAQPSNGSVSTLPSKSDADFLVSAAAGGSLEVRLGHLAQTHSSNQYVKAFGAMMVKDHGAGSIKIKSLAKDKKLTLPHSISDEQKKDMENLQKKNGTEFDHAYIRLMVADHKDDIREFQNEAKNGTDPQIAAFAGNSLSMLQKHLHAADSLRRVLGLDDLQGIPPAPIQ
jgi:putative membrane protein